MEQKEFICKYEKNKQIYNEWGNYIKKVLMDELKKKVELSDFLKLDVNVRLKSVDSILYKAFHRDKNYKDPYSDITDKVGMRFVVLYMDDIDLIGDIIEKRCDWNSSKDRDYETEIEKNPDRFGYESRHYIVRNKEEITCNNIKIPIDTPCEIQIRTLLQHAFCEMSHNNTYKKNVHSKVKRITARSMALIESADYFFKEVKDMVNAEEQKYLELLPKLTEYYSTFAELYLEEKINMLIIDNYNYYLNEDTFKEVKSFIESKPFLKESIKKNHDIRLLYRQPVVLLLYYLVDKYRSDVFDKWPLTEDELMPIYNDLGYSLNC